ncbi:dTDP-4-dehydrorhamnose reductase [Kordia sp. YSTF-M3]|uniref:dTDP-4-dehydrorhamnose reductase n=1 Tax=Kordia aestuariivivens TaxID=2759037 RepID=A0ABR7Q9V6_9FLAO|nr:dTDP-4-dehydrorhamnose reductase [Kordia aestuariivivens]MBC8755352.1 dTDP-4-dehydrorhamnose reductase [Kordia aestuariivivens]
MKTVLVTGANGQLGQCIQKIQNQHSGINFHFKSSSELDITNREAINDYFSTHAIDYCVNCAAYTNVELAESETDKAYLVNAEAAKHLAEACAKHNTTLIHISTDYVFDGTKTEPYLETDQTNPISVYGASKLKGEQNIQEAIQNHFIIRTSWLYAEFGKNFYKTILQKAKEKANLTITTEQKGTPTNANDLAELILEIINTENTDYGIYHFSNEGEATWYDFTKEIIKNLNLASAEKPTLQSVASYKTKAARPENSVLDKTKVRTIIQTISWQESLRNLMK